MVACCIMVRVFELDMFFDCLPQRNLRINLIDLKEGWFEKINTNLGKNQSFYQCNK